MTLRLLLSRLIHFRKMTLSLLILMRLCHHSVLFTMLSVRDVKQLIQNSALKSCPLDPMFSTLVSKCEDLLPVLTKIFNNSLQSWCFPQNWKEALVFPLLKKPGLDVIFKNFRPVSNLSFVSKLIERAALNQIHGHLVCNILYPVAQSAYRSNHGTETGLLKVMNDILLNMNKQHVAILAIVAIYCRSKQNLDTNQETWKPV